MILHLIEKADGYDPSRGTPEAFVTLVVNTWIKQQLRFRGRQKRAGDLKTVSLSQPATSADGKTLEDSVTPLDRMRRLGLAKRDPLRDLDDSNAIDSALAKLTPDDRSLLHAVIDGGVSAAARERGVSRGVIDRRLAAMRPVFEWAGFFAE